MKKIIFAAVLLICLINTKLAAGNGTSSALFLRMPTSAAISGMGGAYTSFTDDINSIYANAGGLGFIKNRQFIFMHNNYIQDFNYNYLAYCQPVKMLDGVVGAHISYFDAGDLDRTLIATGVTYTNAGSFDARDMEAGLSYGKKITDKLNGGLTLKYISSKIDNVKASAVASDFGVIYDCDEWFDQSVKFGFTVKNIGTKLKYDSDKESLPVEYKFGMSSAFPVNDALKITPAFDVVYSRNEDCNFNVGSEFNFVDSFFVRFGFDSAIDAGNGISCGFGFKLQNLSLDYAFTNYDNLGDGHRISLTIK